MGIERRKVLASLSPELPVTVQRLSCRCEPLSHEGGEWVKKGVFLYSDGIDIGALVVIPPSRHTK